MGNFKGYKSIIAELHSLAEKLDQSTLSKEELNRFTTLSREIYERSVILNYKALENEVFNKNEKTAEVKNNDSSTDKKIEESLGEIENDEQKIEESNKDEQPVFDFADEDFSAKKEDEFSFDFSEDDEQLEDDELKVETKKELDAKEVELENQKEEEIIEEPEVEEVNETSKTTVTTERLTEISSDDKVISFYEKFTQVHDESVLAMLGSQKIDTLKGAFGLNDKLQIINELFNGDSDEFSKTIETLDSFDSDEKARIKLSEIAAHHQWEPDHRLVEDFAKMVERRYAQ
jgi:hypothetical protein